MQFVLPKKMPGIFISASFSRSRSKHPTLLSHGEIKTLAHELGHAIHSLVQGVQGLRRQIPRDFIEIPSITGENWVYLPSLLRQISCHYTYLDPTYLAAWKSDHPTSRTLPPQQAPLNMFKEIVYKRNPKNDLADIQYLLWASQFDFIIHSASEEELKSMDFGKICSQILTEWAGIFTANSGNDAAPKTKYLPNNQYLHMNELKNYDTSTYCYLL
jgi:metallopeptidase MepB